jgi:hypothetical protein
VTHVTGVLEDHSDEHLAQRHGTRPSLGARARDQTVGSGTNARTS